jgi:uncharacterized protein (TIGR03083 family)
MTEDPPATFDRLRSAVLETTEQLAADVVSLGPDDWKRRTRCPSWTIRDLAWHVAWGEGPGEVISAAKQGLEPPAYATERMGPPPEPADIIRSMNAKREQTRADLEALRPQDANLVVRYGRNDQGRPIVDWFWHTLTELVVHDDDLRCALGATESVDVWLADGLTRRRVHIAVDYAARDSLQPIAPRGYRLTTEQLDCGFFFKDGIWRDGIDDDVPTCTFTGDSTTLLRLVMGRIPAHPWDNGLWDSRLRLSGDLGSASPNDFKRWCYGVW